MKKTQASVLWMLALAVLLVAFVFVAEPAVLAAEADGSIEATEADATTPEEPTDGETVDPSEGAEDPDVPEGGESTPKQGLVVENGKIYFYNEDGTLSAIVPLERAPEIVTKRIIEDLDRAYYPTKMIVPSTEIVHDRANLEVFRGCIRGCRFCQAGMIYRPYRQKSPEILIENAKVILVMPNTPMMLGFGASAMAKGESVSDEEFIPVVEIGNSAFVSKSEIYTVSLPKTVALKESDIAEIKAES